MRAKGLIEEKRMYDRQVPTPRKGSLDFTYSMLDSNCRPAFASIASRLVYEASTKRVLPDRLPNPL